jgi:hypothetical protein
MKKLVKNILFILLMTRPLYPMNSTDNIPLTVTDLNVDGLSAVKKLFIFNNRSQQERRLCNFQPSNYFTCTRGHIPKLVQALPTIKNIPVSSAIYKKKIKKALKEINETRDYLHSMLEDYGHEKYDIGCDNGVSDFVHSYNELSSQKIRLEKSLKTHKKYKINEYAAIFGLEKPTNSYSYTKSLYMLLYAFINSFYNFYNADNNNDSLPTLPFDVIQNHIYPHLAKDEYTVSLKDIALIELWNPMGTEISNDTSKKPLKDLYYWDELYSQNERRQNAL